MAAAADMLKKVFELKRKLNESSDSEKILKTLKTLQNLDITQNILAETRIEKAVNAFQKHPVAGGLARSLVIQWRKLAAQDSTRCNVQAHSSGGHSKFSGRHVSEITNGAQVASSEEMSSSRAPEVTLEHQKKEEKSEKKVKKRDGEEVVKRLKKRGKSASESRPSEDGSGKPAMCFESCLNYDMKASQRKKQPFVGWKTGKKLKAPAPGKGPQGKFPSGKSLREQPEQPLEETPKKLPTGSVMDLLNIPLPVFVLDSEDFTSFPYIETEPEEECAVAEEGVPQFIGERLHSRMQVYAGVKTCFLPTMMSLYQQCVRTLQNNLDMLSEVGGVPFDILEPVLERCTPEQLLRIEKWNPVYIGQSDGLWEAHCRRDFRNACLEEGESWRAMHLRLSQQRERKLQMLRERITTTYSGKPKGRQAKLTFIDLPRKETQNCTDQTGTTWHRWAGDLIQSASVSSASPPNQPSASRARPSSSNATGSTSQSQGSRKRKRMAPLMAKSVKAFKMLQRR